MTIFFRSLNLQKYGRNNRIDMSQLNEKPWMTTSDTRFRTDDEPIKNNGRINFEDTPGAGGKGNIPGFGWRTTGDETAKADMIRGNWEPNALNQTFFSPENVQIIQNLIRKTVYDNSPTKDIIDPQSTDELLIVMRSIYLTYGRNEPTNIRGQIIELNQRVADWSVPKILSEISMYKTYRKDASTLPVPMSHPVNISPSGTKSKPFTNFF